MPFVLLSIFNSCHISSFVSLSLYILIFVLAIPVDHYSRIIKLPDPTQAPTKALPRSPAGFVVNNHGQEIEFIFGFSTGHVGTTSLGKSSLYCAEGGSALSCEKWSSNILFKHEFLVVLWDNYIEWGPKGMAGYVYGEYFPNILNLLSKENKPIYFDVGHQNLYFIEPLLQYLIDNNYKHNIIRLRCRRIEVAESLIHRNFQMDHNLPVDAIQAMSFKYKPYEGETDKTILKMSKTEFDKFSFFQKALWLVDEVELRWQRLKKTYPKMNYTDVYWENYSNNSNFRFESAVLNIAKKVLDYPADNSFHMNANIHEKSHIVPEIHSSIMPKFGIDEEIYQEVMEYQKSFSKYNIDWTWSQYPELPSSYNTFDPYMKPHEGPNYRRLRHTRPNNL